MEENVPDNFEDPALKAALKQALGLQATPAMLRARIMRMAQENRAAAPWSGFRYAAAAAVILGLGTMGWLFVRGYHSTSEKQLVLADLIATHDFCTGPSHLPGHRGTGIPQDDFKLMGQRLAGQLNHPVMAFDLPGWRFDGAAKCPVGKTPSAHLVFDKGEDTLSIFSFKSPPNGTGSIAQNIDGHWVATVEHEGTLYCVVGKGPDLSLGDVQKILTDHDHQAILPPIAAERGTELLHNIAVAGR